MAKAKAALTRLAFTEPVMHDGKSYQAGDGVDGLDAKAVDELKRKGLVGEVAGEEAEAAAASGE